MNPNRLSVVGVLAASAALAAPATPAFAQSLEGDTLQAIIGYGTLPDLNVVRTTDVGPVVNGPADRTQIHGTDESAVFLDVDANRFTLDFTSITFDSGYDFNGIVLDGLDFPGDPERRVTGARLVSLVNTGYFGTFGGAKNLSITPDSIALDLGRWGFSDASIGIEVHSRVDLMLVGDTVTVTAGAGSSPADIIPVRTTYVGPITDDASDETIVLGDESSPHTVDLDGERLTVRVAYSGNVPFDGFYGLVISDLDFADPRRQVTGLDLVEVINGDGFEASNLIVLDDGSIALDFAGRHLEDATIVIDLQSAIVPEPATAGTLAAFATGLLLRRRR